mgnify:CR=1 FL=1
MVPLEDERVIETMEESGGSFVKALAECFRRADRVNYSKLKSTFKEYFSEYRLMANGRLRG